MRAPMKSKRKEPASILGSKALSLFLGSLSDGFLPGGLVLVLDGGSAARLGEALGAGLVSPVPIGSFEAICWRSFEDDRSEGSLDIIGPPRGSVTGGV